MLVGWVVGGRELGDRTTEDCEVGEGVPVADSESTPGAPPQGSQFLHFDIQIL